MTNADKAAATFKEGFSCSQAVLGTYCEQFGLDKELAYKINVEGTGAVIEACKINNVRKLIYISSIVIHRMVFCVLPYHN